MKRIRFILPFFAIALGAGCHQSQDSDLVAAAFTLGASNRLTGNTQRVAATGAIAAMSAAGSGLNTGASAFLGPRYRDRLMMLAMIRKYGRPGTRNKPMFAHRRERRSMVIPATFDCTGAVGNDCANAVDGSSYQLDGTEDCDDGTGIITANTISIVFNNDNDLFSYTTSGNNKFTFSGGCGAYSVDFAHFPDYQMNTMTGSMKSIGTISSTVAETDSSISGFTFVDTQVTTTSADNYTVDGGAKIIMDLRVQNVESKNLFFDANTDEILFGTASANITLTGTIDGAAVNVTTNYVVAF